MMKLYSAMACVLAFAALARGAEKPNIVFILADDLGYGDVHCLNPDRGKIPTPNLDRLAGQGMTFTDAHSSSAVCTPTRYGLLTGRYNWRSRLQSAVLWAYDKPLIDRDRLTVPTLLKKHGYRTACVGKWHLGWEWPEEVFEARQKQGKKTEADEVLRALWRQGFSKPIAEGPTTRGFDYFFGNDAPNFPPYCFIENDHTVGIPSEFPRPALFGNKLIHIRGPALAGWRLEPILPTCVAKANEFIARCSKEGKPFFLYLPLTSPHLPLAVNENWKGRSGLNLYADFVMETDAEIGRVLDALEQSGAAENTVVFFASDNGCSPAGGVKELEKKGHYPSAQLRGYKADAWDGGHRIPFFARWPGKIKPSGRCSQLVCLNDLMATCAAILGEKLPDEAGEDSVNILPLLEGGDQPVREAVVHHSINGKFAIRQGRWKLMLCPGSGGWCEPKDKAAKELGLPRVQLYDMEADPGETTNLHEKHPEVVERLTRLLKKYVADGRSTPGKPQKNDVFVDIWKNGK